MSGIAAANFGFVSLHSCYYAGCCNSFSQNAVFAVPLVIGVMFVLCARRFARLVATFSVITDEEIALPDPTALMRVVLACIGIFMLIKSGSFLGQHSYQAVVMRVGNPALGFQMQPLIPQTSQVIALVLQCLSAVVLIRQAAPISAWFQRRWER
jgi:hypothetical protein